jgi:hypothetical protein
MCLSSSQVYNRFMITLAIPDPLVPVPAPDRRRNVRPGAPPPSTEPHCVITLSGDDRRQLERAAQVRPIRVCLSSPPLGSYVALMYSPV